MEENQYQAPESALVEENAVSGELASRWARLGAALIDSLIMGLLIAPALFLLGFFDQLEAGAEPGLMWQLQVGLIGTLVWLAVNIKFLIAKGQTVGKKLLKIRIVTLSGEYADPKSALLPRYAFYIGIGYIPVIGSILSLINVLFVFRADKRCIHDLIAKTKVVKC